MVGIELMGSSDPATSTCAAAYKPQNWSVRVRAHAVGILIEEDDVFNLHFGGAKTP